MNRAVSRFRLKHVTGLVREVMRFAWENKAWWLVPLVLTMLLMSFLIVAGQSVAPFIYTLF